MFIPVLLSLASKGIIYKSAYLSFLELGLCSTVLLKERSKSERKSDNSVYAIFEPDFSGYEVVYLD